MLVSQLDHELPCHSVALLPKCRVLQVFFCQNAEILRFLSRIFMFLINII